MKLRKAVYWTVDEGLWSPRDQRYGWRTWDTYETEAEARKEIRRMLKEAPSYTIMLTKVEMLEAWNTVGQNGAQGGSQGSLTPTGGASAPPAFGGLVGNAVHP